MGNACSPAGDNTVHQDTDTPRTKGADASDKDVVENKGDEAVATEPATEAKPKSNRNKKKRAKNRVSKKKRERSRDRDTRTKGQADSDQTSKRKRKQDKQALQSQITQCDQEIVELEKQVAEQQQKLEDFKQSCVEQETEREDKVMQLRDEQNRVARLKLQTQLREKELRVAEQQADETSGCTRTYMEGNLFKFGKQGKLYPKEKLVQVHLLATGAVVLDYCENIRSTKVDRSVIDKVELGERFLSGTTEFYKGRVFAVHCSNNKKIMVFACDNEDDCKTWLTRVQRALEDRPENVEAQPEKVVFEITFDKRPLGFSVDLDMDAKHLIVTSIQSDTLDLVDGVRVLSANGQDFTGKPRTFMLDYLKFEPVPLTIRFEAGPDELKELDIEASVAEPTQRHRPKPSMQDLFPKSSSNDIYNHPLVKRNPEFKTWIENPSFAMLMKDLTKDPEKLDEYLQKDI